jgi:hypothetical protein
VPLLIRARWAIVAIALAVTGALLLHLGRGTTFSFDEWQWVAERRGPGLSTLLDPHNDHLSLVPLAIYKVLFATAGLDHYVPYRVLMTVAHLGVCLLVFVYARRRVGDHAAGLAMLVLLLLGPGWQNLLYPAQVGSLVSLGAAVGAFMALDRRNRLGDVTASVLLALSLASTSLGIPMAAGLAVDILWKRRNWRPLWIVAVPLAVYGLWWIGYQDSAGLQSIWAVPRLVVEQFACTIAALAGLSGPEFPSTGAALEWGRPLGVLAAAVLAWRMWTVPVTGRVLALLTILLVYWCSTGLTRAGISPPDTSRYLYNSGLFAILVAVELSAGVTLSSVARWLVAVAVAAAVVSNVGDLRTAAERYRELTPTTHAVLGAVELSAAHLPPGAPVDVLPGYPLVVLQADAYLKAAREDGSPAASPSEIEAFPEPARQAADQQLQGFARVALGPPPSGQPAGSPPAVDRATGGAARTDAGCAVFEPAAVSVPGPPPSLEVTLPPGGVLLRAPDGAASAALRRFGATYQAPFGRLRAGYAAVVRLPSDAAPQPWHLRVSAADGVTICGLG